MTGDRGQEVMKVSWRTVVKLGCTIVPLALLTTGGQGWKYCCDERSQDISPSFSTLVKLGPATERTEIPVKPVVVPEVKLLSGTPAETLRPLRAARD